MKEMSEMDSQLASNVSCSDFVTIGKSYIHLSFLFMLNFTADRGRTSFTRVKIS